MYRHVLRSRHCERRAGRRIGATAGTYPGNAMHIAILTFDGFNELDSIIALGILNRVKASDWRVSLCCSPPQVTCRISPYLQG